MPVASPGFGEILSRIAAGIHAALYPVSTLVYMLLRLRVTSDIDLAAWALVAWLLGSRESELARKLGFIVAALLAALSLLELVLSGW